MNDAKLLEMYNILQATNELVTALIEEGRYDVALRRLEIGRCQAEEIWDELITK